MRTELELREALFNNHFGINILELTIDASSLAELRQLLDEVATCWRSEAKVDKQIVHYVVELLMILYNKIQYGGFSAEDTSEVIKLYEELQKRLLEDCLV